MRGSAEYNGILILVCSNNNNTLSPRGFQWSGCVQQRSSHRLLTNSYTVTLRRPVQLTRAYSILVSEPAKLHIKHEG